MSDRHAPTQAPPLARLQASRERLREALTPPPPPPPVPPAPIGSVQRWLQSLRRLPVVGEVAGSLGDWWAHHPFRPVARMAGDASSLAIDPVAQRHPLALVGASAAVGAALVWAGPWKWALRTVLFAGLVPRLASKIVSKLPLDSWLALLGTAIAAKKQAPEASVVLPAVPIPASAIPARDRGVSPGVAAAAVPPAL